MKIYLTRHGETQFNRLNLSQSWCDSSLTGKGVLYAKALGAALGDVPLEAAYSSDLRRARETAGYIVEGRGIPVREDPRLREYSSGSRDGDPIPPDEDSLFLTGFARWGGERWDGVAERMRASIDEICARHPHGSVLVVSHGWSILCFLRTVEKKRIDRILEDTSQNTNCSLTILEKTAGGYAIRTLLDPSYVQKGLRITGLDRLDI